MMSDNQFLRDPTCQQVAWSPEKTYKLLSILHHVIVMLDDWICEVGDFSRKPKGKYTQPYQRSPGEASGRRD